MQSLDGSSGRLRASSISGANAARRSADQTTSSEGSSLRSARRVHIDGGKDFLAACPPFARSCSMSDGYAALIGAGSGAPCSLLIMGTGIAGHRLFANGWSIQRDAWGWIAGDRGSGS